MSNTEQSLSRIFALCEKVAETGEPIITQEEAREKACIFLGFKTPPVMQVNCIYKIIQN